MTDSQAASLIPPQERGPAPWLRAGQLPDQGGRLRLPWMRTASPAPVCASRRQHGPAAPVHCYSSFMAKPKCLQIMRAASSGERFVLSIRR